MSLFGPKKIAPGYSLIDERLTIRGEIETDGTVRVEGRIEGTSHRAGTLIVSAHGNVVGAVEAGDVLAAGVITGDIHATGRVVVEAGAAVYGLIRANSMQMHEGAAVHGMVAVGTAPATPMPEPAVASRRLELTTMDKAGSVRL